MSSVNFNNKLEELINELKELQKKDVTNDSYAYLINKLSQLSSENFDFLKELILHFIVDSYNGDINVGDKIIQFMKLYSSKDFYGK